MRQGLVLVLVMAVLVAMYSEVNAQTTNTSAITDYELLENTDYCFTDCYLRFRFMTNGTLKIEKQSDFEGKFVKKGKAKDLQDWGFRLGKNVSYKETRWVSDITCNPYNETTPNGTIEHPNCVDNGYEENTKKTKIVYEDFDPINKNFKPDEWHYVEMWGRKQPDGGDIDAVPSLWGFDLPFAWWSDYDYKREITAGCTTCSGSITMPILINDTAFYLNGWPQYAWCNYTVTNSVTTVGYLYYKDETNYTCVNSAEDAEVAMDVDEGNMSDINNPWETGAVGIYHMNGTDVHDSSGDDNHGTGSGIGANAGGKIAGAIEFGDEEDDEVIFGSDLLDGATQFTMMGWLYMTDTGTAQQFINNADGSNVYSIAIQVVDGAAGRTCRLIVDLNTGAKSAISTEAVGFGKWVHVAGVWNTTHVLLYVNGEINGTPAAAVGTIDTITSVTRLGIFGPTYRGYDFYGLMDEVRVYDRFFSPDEIMAHYNNSVGTHGFSSLGAEETPVVVNTSLLGASFNISDFSFSSSDFVTAFNGTFVITETLGLVLMSSMNIEKVSAGGTSVVSIRISVDGSTMLTEELRTVSSTGDIGSVAITPTTFTVDAGNHNITYEFSRTGAGTITVDNIDAILLQNASNAGNAVRMNTTPAVYTHSSTDFVEAFNWTIPKSALSRTYYTIKQTVSKATSGSSTLSYYFEDLTDPHITPYWQRILSGAADVGSVAGAYIDVAESGDLNYTIQSRQSDAGDTVSVNGTIIDIDMIDSDGVEIPAFQASNELTNLTNSITLEAGTHNFVNATITMDDGDAYFLSMMTSFSSASGAQTPEYFINSSNSSVSCRSSKQRSLANGDIGNAVIYMLCENLTVDSDYVFNLYVTVPAGETITQLDESLSGFEITTFNITVINTPPIVAILDPDEDEVVAGESVNINWTTTDLQGDRYLTNVSIQNSTDTINISTQLGDHISNITWNSTAVSDGLYNLIVLSYENATTELLEGNDTIEIAVDNIFSIPTICEVDPILIFEGEIVIGWRFDCP